MVKPLSYLSPKTEVGESPIHGRGLFAVADIAKDEVVAVKGGHIVDRETLQRESTPTLGPVEIQIGDDLFITPVTQEERELSMLYSNHSCDANLGLSRRDHVCGDPRQSGWRRAYPRLGNDR